MVLDPVRPDPDALLARMKAEANTAQRGQLKVFLGACAGVGKTYTMLETARARRNEKVDVVAGLVETHGRRETESLLVGLDILPRKEILYRDVRLREFDLDAALRRKPQVILVDELAHTNAPGSRHLKRWQDVKELLDNGISVYTTLNIQHLESLVDVVAQITGLTVAETVPDSFVAQADSIELVDLPFEELLKRLQDGKVYLPEQAERARQNFFRPGNLSALRELALRFTAERVNTQVQALRPSQPGVPTWPTAERLLVLVGPSPYSARLVRRTYRMASAFRCEWIALHVEDPSQLRLAKDEQERTIMNMRLAAKLGAETVTLSGASLVETVISLARERNITRIILGKPDRRTLRDWMFGSSLDHLVHRSAEIDVVVTQGDPEGETVKPVRNPMRVSPRRGLRYGASVVVVACCTLLCAFIYNLYNSVETTNIVMVYLLGVVILASRLGRGPAVVASFLSVLAFDYFFIPPRLSFAINDTQYLFTFLVMLVVVLVISTLTVRLRDVARKTQRREHRTASLHALSRKLAVTRGQEAILQATAQHIAELFSSEVVALLPNDSKMLQVRASQPPGQTLDFKDRSVAQWGYDMHEMAGRGTDTVPSADRLYIPLLSPRGSFGSLGLKSADPLNLMIPEQLQLLEALAQQAALALEVDRLTEEAGKQNVLIETERLRSALLSSVSHDLRTPLAAITGSASSLLDTGNPLPESSRQEILQTIFDEAERLNDQVNNLLEMTRLESGNLNVRKELQPLEETVGSACQRLERFLRGRPVRIDIPSDLPLVFADGVLLEKVFLNLLDNVIKYTPPGSPVAIAARRQDREVLVEVRDNGPGLGEGEEEKIFDKFHRGARHNKPGGAGLGLGLTICRGIIQAHGGKIWAENRAEGGAVFRFTLPLPSDAGADEHGLQADAGEMKR